MNNSIAKNSILPQLEAGQKASHIIQSTTDETRNKVLLSLAALINTHQEAIIQANEKDLVRMEDSNPKKDRLKLSPERIQGLQEGLKAVANLASPTGKILLKATTKEGLDITKESVPLGVVGIIYESRPNVTIDVAALCIKSGNASILRGGSDAIFSNQFLVGLIHEALAQNDLPEAIVQLLPTDRALVKELLEAEQYVDIIIPRGSQSLIDFVRDNAIVPTIETGAGVCHTYVQKEADLDMASAIVVNAKVSRPSVCNALDTVLVDKAIAATFLPTLIQGFSEARVTVFADQEAYEILGQHAYPWLEKATHQSYGKEYLSYQCSIKVVNDFDEAIEHIRLFSSRHSEAIVTKDKLLAEQFLKTVDAAAVYVNASTRFTDGGVFGLGAEIGISTQKLHARGPFALEKLTTEKWIIRGNGQIR